MAQVPETVREGAARARPGRTIADCYETLFRLGQGGMGSVEAALERRDDGNFTRIVALKRLLPEGARDPRLIDMFMREARLATLVEHPNVVRAFDYGEDDGELYLAMEYVEGETLSNVLARAREKEGGLVAPLVAYVLAETADALGAAHTLHDADGQELGVVHRDVSPQNVMISYDGFVKLLDFGVAKIASETALTRTGEVKGKVPYMSPEQALGEELDARSDLYSLGAVLFECLTGRRMWTGTEMEVLRKLALQDPPDLAEALPTAPSALVTLHRSLVAKDIAERPTSAAETSARLRAYIATTGTAPNTDVLRAVMARLFEGDAVTRKERLDSALKRVAPRRAGDLRKSLGDSAGTLPRLPESALVEPTTRASAATSTDDGSWSGSRHVIPKTTGRALWIAPLVLAGLAGGAWALLRTRSESISASTPQTTSSARPTMPAEISLPVRPPPPAMTSAPNPPSASAAPREPPPHTPPKPNARPRPTEKTAPKPATKPGHQRPSPPLDDVDPTPF